LVDSFLGCFYFKTTILNLKIEKKYLIFAKSQLQVVIKKSSIKNQILVLFCAKVLVDK
jgi:hypothetical protein